MKLCGLLAISLLGLVQLQEYSPSDEGPPPEIARFLELCDTARRGAILETEHKLRGLRQTDSLTKETRAQISLLEGRLLKLKTTPLAVLPALSFPPQVGAIGRLPGNHLHVDQVVSKREILVRCSFSVAITTVQNFQRRREIVKQSVSLLLRGFELPSLREGMDIETDAVFEVTGVEVYRTEGGAKRSLNVLVPVELKTLQRYLPQGELANP